VYPALYADSLCSFGWLVVLFIVTSVAVENRRIFVMNIRGKKLMINKI
jgi:hypothetical protein